jgi:hypothetical protein
MAHDASEILGSPRLAGVKVNPRGMGSNVMANNAGMYAGLIGAVITAPAAIKARKKAAEAKVESTAPKFGRLAYLAVTTGEVALVELKTKRAVSLVLNDVLARMPRAEVASAELGGGHTMLSPPLTITFKSGDSWLLEVPRPNKKQAEELVGVLAGTQAGI